MFYNYLLPIILLLMSIQCSFAQEEDLPSTYHPLNFGLEQDPVPYLNKGYILTAWLGMQHTRARVSYAKVQQPPFMLRHDILSEEISATQLSIEFFFKEDFKGLWLGPSIGYWWNRVQTSSGFLHDYPSVLFSVVGGYQIYLFKGLYISPYFAGHLRLTGMRDVEVGSLDYRPHLLLPELSLKVGYKF
jgi:hypothetical protein